MIRVLIVDDHPVVRDGLAAVLGTQPDLEIAGLAGTGQQAIHQVAALRPDVVLMDLKMPTMDGATTTAAIKATHSNVRVLVLTTYDTDADIAAAVDAGADGYVLKQASRDELCAAVRTVAKGGSALSPAIAAKVLNRMRGESSGGLSSREIDVLTAVARGHSNKQVARQLHLSEATVKTHLLHIYAKLGVADRTAAVTTALERGIIRLD
ncbi:MAG TPA: response regulator transcription factor [Jiangellaceae bacterium]|nr:response regulator transcription factor [Jiangellaceae bacterium]